MIYIIGVVWLLYSAFWFYILNYTVKNIPETYKDMGDVETIEIYLKYHLIFNLIAAIVAPVVHLWQAFYFVMKTVLFGSIDLVGKVFKVEKGKK